MKMLYKYPQVAYPYDELVQRQRPAQPDGTGVRIVRRPPRYFLGQSLLRRFHRIRQGGRSKTCCAASSRRSIAVLTRRQFHVLPHLWYRNVWSWEPGVTRSTIKAVGPGAATTEHEALGNRWWYARAGEHTPSICCSRKRDQCRAAIPRAQCSAPCEGWDQRRRGERLGGWLGQRPTRQQARGRCQNHPGPG